MPIARRRSLAVALVAAAASTITAVAAQPGSSSANAVRNSQQTTLLISRTPSGAVPNGPSGDAVISGDKRYARAIAFESDASNLVSGDTDGVKDVFVVARVGKIDNSGGPWTRGQTALVSRTFNGQPPNGPSFAPAIDGGFARPSARRRRRHGHPKRAAARADSVPPSCVAFLSAASNMVAGDTNGHVDAFVTTLQGGAPIRVSPAQSSADATAVAVSGDCTRIATVVGGRLFVFDHKKGVTHAIQTNGPVTGPSFAVGRTNDLVFATPTGVFLSRRGTGTPRLIALGGRNPSFNDLKRRVVAYEKKVGVHWQVFFRRIGKGEAVASRRGGALGDGDSRNPRIGNAGFAMAFETDATNLGVNALGRKGDDNGVADVYLYTDVRKITLLQSTEQKAVPLPGGGRHPAMSYYNNYILFDSPAPLAAPLAIPGAASTQQVFMRYLGPV